MATASEYLNKNHGYIIFWRIENFQCKMEDQFLLSSPNFGLKNIQGNWKMEIKQKNGFLAAYLFKEASNIRTKIFLSVSLLTESGWNNVLRTVEVTYEAFCTSWGDNDIISLENLEKQKPFYLPRESFTVSFHVWNCLNKNACFQKLLISELNNDCELSHQPIENFSCLTYDDMLYFLPSFKFPTSTSEKSLKAIKNDLTPRLLSDIEEYSEGDIFKLLKRKNLGFVTIRTADKDFFALKAVLSAESPVIRKVIENVGNDDCNLVYINDIDSDTMTMVITFLHYKTLKVIKWKILPQLFNAAYKYEIGRLRRFCVSFLKEELRVENIGDAITLADNYQNRQLMTYIQKFFRNNSDSILQSEHWKEFFNNNSKLAAIVLRNIAETSPARF